MPKKIIKKEMIAPHEVEQPLWISVSEAAKFGGVQTKTIRRAIEAETVKFIVSKNRYHINLSSLISYLLKTTKLKNKFIKKGLGQYVDSWK